MDQTTRIQSGMKKQIQDQLDHERLVYVGRVAEKMLRAIVSSSGDEAIDQVGASFMVKTAFMLAETFVAEDEKRYAKRG